MKLWGGRYSEPLDVVPVTIVDVSPGCVCRLWFMPNQTRFVVLGVSATGTTKVVLQCGTIIGFQVDALVVVVSDCPEGFPNLIDEIAGFENDISKRAWGGTEA